MNLINSPQSRIDDRNVERGRIQPKTEINKEVYVSYHENYGFFRGLRGSQLKRFSKKFVSNIDGARRKEKSEKSLLEKQEVRDNNGKKV